MGKDIAKWKILDSEYLLRHKYMMLRKDKVELNNGHIINDYFVIEKANWVNVIAITDPVYPVYLDTNVMAGRTGTCGSDGRYDGIIYLPVNADNNFVPELPEKRADIIYICCPNNPTGTTMTRPQLKKWVDYARENESIILFDAAYNAFITEEDVPHSIFEIDGAKECAIEFRSFSKTAGFTGTRCGYIVLPKTVKARAKDGSLHALNKLWNRRHTTKFNGTAYIVQRGAEAVFSDEGKRQVKETIDFYLENARIIRDGLTSIGITAYGGVNAPYIWLKTPNDMPSWDFFDKLLNEANVIGTPGAGFGPCGEGYFRLTAFGKRADTIEAVQRIKEKLSI